MAGANEEGAVEEQASGAGLVKAKGLQPKEDDPRAQLEG